MACCDRGADDRIPGDIISEMQSILAGMRRERARRQHRTETVDSAMYTFERQK